MASIKQLDERRYKITVSNGYRPNGKKNSKAKTIQIPPGVPKRGIGQYVAHAAEELERSFKTGYAEDGEMTFEEFASRWLKRQTKYAPSTIAAYWRMLEVVYPMIGGIRLNKLRPMALENMLSALRKRKHHGKLINESTVQRYLSVVSAVLSDAKRNEIIEKNPARMLDLPTPQRTVQRIPTRSEVEKLLDTLAKEPRHYRLFYLLSMYTGCRWGELCALQWSDFTGTQNGLLGGALVRQRRFDGGLGLFRQCLRLIQHFAHRVHGRRIVGQFLIYIKEKGQSRVLGKGKDFLAGRVFKINAFTVQFHQAILLILQG